MLRSTFYSNQISLPHPPGNATTAQLIFAFGVKDSLFWILEEANLILVKLAYFTPDIKLIHSYKPLILHLNYLSEGLVESLFSKLIIT